MDPQDYEQASSLEGFSIGDSVMWRGWFGMDAPRRATISGFGEKNGRPLADLDNGHWAYLTQLSPIRGNDA